jgi:putative thiamine transport system substrate-binding protein
MNLFNRRQSLTLLGAAVLVPSVTPTWAQGTTTSPTTSTTPWPDTLRAARGQTVYFNAWAGSERINA